MLYSSFEDMITVIAGPRVGKSTSLVIPAITAAPGAVVTTSNKRDVLDATRDLRTDAGDVWVFDPQGVAREDASWWWNPLSYVTDDVRAAKLAQYFADGSRATDAKTDAFFDAAGQNLLAGLLLAAATAHRPIRDVFSWLTDPLQEEPVRLLRDGGYELAAEAVLGVIQSTDKLRGSVYSTAQEMAACLKNTHVTDWVNPRPGHDPRPQFHPDAFVTGRGTLYSLSKEGAGTAGPLVTALTAATLEAATDLADTSARRPAARAVGRDPRRSRERLPVAGPPRPLLPLRLPRHPDHVRVPVLVPRRRRLRPRGHAQALLRHQRLPLPRRCAGERLPAEPDRDHRRLRPRDHHRQPSTEASAPPPRH